MFTKGKLIWMLFLCFPIVLVVSQLTISASVWVSSNSACLDSEAVPISITLQNEIPVAGIELHLTYDDSNLTVSDVIASSRTDSLSVFEWATGNPAGQLKLLIFDIGGRQISPGTGSLGEILIAPAPGADPGKYALTLSEVILGDSSGRSIPTTAKDGTLYVKNCDGIKSEMYSPFPGTFALSQNHPNPFNSTTLIRYSIPDRNREVRPHRTTLKIYNILGQEVRTLVDEKQPAGYYQILWDGRDQTGEEVASGIYFYRLKAGKFNKVSKMVVLR